MALYSKLKELHINFEEFKHPPARTAEDLASCFAGKPFQQVKNLFLYDKKKRFYLVAARSESVVNLKVLASKLKAVTPRFANEEQMRMLLQVTPGAVTPLSIMHDTKNEVTVVFDDAFKTSTEPLLVHPLHNEATITISLDDLLKFVTSCKHEVTWVDFSKVEEDITNEVPAVVNAKETATLTTTGGGSEMLGITVKKSENFSEWYTQVITRSEMVEYYDISGCYILRPSSYFIWEKIQEFFNKEMKRLKVQNCYFPIFVSKQRLETEKEHVEGFSPEVAWVTKYGDSDLPEPIAIRPTSETIMYPAYAKWIRSHRDLPLLLNQWCQVVRWEFKQPTPFIRTREFLWQEGHTAHATDEDAMKTVLEVLDIYENIYQNLLAVPVIKGFKSEKEKFAGGKITTTVETLIPSNGRGVQAATSHHLGQNFSKMFKIEFEDQDRQRQFAHQTSWAITTRSIGVAVMLHGDDKGMVMPPRVAPVQVVVIPIIYKDVGTKELLNRCASIVEELTRLDVRARIDDRDNYTPGWKYNDWEKKGVCIRLEVGPEDMKNQTVRAVRRDTNEKMVYQWNEVAVNVSQTLESIHENLLRKAKEVLDASIVKVTSFDEVMNALNDKKLILAPWCEDPETEELIKKRTTLLSAEQQQDKATADEDGSLGSPALTGAMKPLCIPIVQPAMASGTECFFSKGKLAKRWCLFGRSY